MLSVILVALLAMAVANDEPKREIDILALTDRTIIVHVTVGSSQSMKMEFNQHTQIVDEHKTKLRAVSFVRSEICTWATNKRIHFSATGVS